MKSFNPQTTTVDSHTKDILGNCRRGKCRTVEGVYQAGFLWLRPVQRCPENIFVLFLLQQQWQDTLETTTLGTMILGYLALFRLHELGFERFRSFIMADEPLKMMVFLEFVFNDETLDITLKDELCRIFDRDFVEDDIVVRVKKFFSEAAVLMDDLRMKAYGIAAAKAKKEEDKVNAFKGKGPTKFAPFKLNTPRPRKVSEPMKIEQGIKAKPVPHRLLNKTLSCTNRRRGQEAKSRVPPKNIRGSMKT